MNTQFCFCGPGGAPLPAHPLAQHQAFCLVWDWAAAHDLISWEELMTKLDQAREELGITREEVAEAERAWQNRSDAG